MSFFLYFSSLSLSLSFAVPLRLQLNLYFSNIFIKDFMVENKCVCCASTHSVRWWRRIVWFLVYMRDREKEMKTKENTNDEYQFENVSQNEKYREKFNLINSTSIAGCFRITTTTTTIIIIFK